MSKESFGSGFSPETETSSIFPEGTGKGRERIWHVLVDSLSVGVGMGALLSAVVFTKPLIDSLSQGIPSTELLQVALSVAGRDFIERLQAISYAAVATTVLSFPASAFFNTMIGSSIGSLYRESR